jgi:5-oxopent-3-ene-1,2,5-tricarboxylate decarboxylase / 2-hydroxyhepta-2,4-diene-1,7-dioate isomerase
MKILAVHLNYRSRAAQRGRTPAVPSYFVKPSTTVIGDGEKVHRPEGCELLAFEGEVALVIGRTARRVDPADAWSHVSHVAAANDLGVYDLRHADQGSNVRSKGWDGSTPLGPMVDAATIDPTALRIRTSVDGEVRQDDQTSDLIFPLADLVADLSHVMTLEPGDLILSGTPAGSAPVNPGSTVTVELLSLDGAVLSAVASPIVDADAPLSPLGPAPKVTAADRAMAIGVNAPRPVELDDELRQLLTTCATATLTAQLQRRGIRSTFMAGLRPTQPGMRLLGYAFTLRYVPMREDLADQYATGLHAQRRAAESIGPDEVLVIEARDDEGAATIGDIIALRSATRGATGIVTDGCLRDTPTIAAMDLPVYYRASHAATLQRQHLPLDINVPVACAGVLVMPGDIIVGDGEGVMVIPAALANEVARDAAEQEEREIWAAERVAAGESIVGIFPLTDARRPEFEAWRATREGS